MPVTLYVHFKYFYYLTTQHISSNFFLLLDFDIFLNHILDSYLKNLTILLSFNNLTTKGLSK